MHELKASGTDRREKVGHPAALQGTAELRRRSGSRAILDEAPNPQLWGRSAYEQRSPGLAEGWHSSPQCLPNKPAIRVGANIAPVIETSVLRSTAFAPQVCGYPVLDRHAERVRRSR